MTDQELIECVTEVKYSAIPEPSKKKIINALMENQQKSKETVREMENLEARR